MLRGSIPWWSGVDKPDLILWSLILEQRPDVDGDAHGSIRFANSGRMATWSSVSLNSVVKSSPSIFFAVSNILVLTWHIHNAHADAW